MFNALVTMVSANRSGPSSGSLGSQRRPSSRETAVVVVPPFIATTHPGETSVAASGGDPLLFVVLTGRLVPEREVIGDGVGNGASTRSDQETLRRQFVQIAPRGGGRNIEFLGDIVNGQGASAGQRVQNCAETLMSKHEGHPHVDSRMRGLNARAARRATQVIVA